jgi:cytochrome c
MIAKFFLSVSAFALVSGLMLAAPEGNVEKGKEVFEQCGVCHSTDGEKKMGPTLKGLFQKDKLHNGKKPTDENVKAIINAGSEGMPGYEEILSEEERVDLMAYLKTL